MSFISICAIHVMGLHVDVYKHWTLVITAILYRQCYHGLAMVTWGFDCTVLRLRVGLGGHTVWWGSDIQLGEDLEKHILYLCVPF